MLRLAWPRHPSARRSWSQATAPASWWAPDRLKALIAYPGSRPVETLLQGPVSMRSRLVPNLQALSRYQHDETSTHRRDRKFAATPVRNRNLHDRSGTCDCQRATEHTDLHRGDDGPWTKLSLS